MLIRVLVAAVLLFAGGSGAQTAYPLKPVQVIVGFSAGGSVDVMARTLVNAISAQLGQSFVIVNRDGASGSIGFAQLANAQPDGYPLGAGPTTPISIAPHLMKNIKFGVDSFDYLCQSFENVFTVAVPLDSPFRSMNEILAAARAKPGKLTYGHSGVGTVPHLAIANFVYRSGVDVPAVPYRGEASMFTDLIAGRVDMGGSSVALAVGQRVRVLAVFSETRHPAFPDAPTFSELGMPSMPPGFNGLFAPKGTPREVRALIERACEQAVQTESFRSTAQKLSQRIAYLNGAVFAERAATDPPGAGCRVVGVSVAIHYRGIAIVEKKHRFIQMGGMTNGNDTSGIACGCRRDGCGDGRGRMRHHG